MSEFYSEDEVVATVPGLTRARLVKFVAARIVWPVQGEQGAVYRRVDVARLELLRDLADDFELPDDALAVVMSLVDQLHSVRADLRAVCRAITQEPAEVRERLTVVLRGR